MINDPIIVSDSLVAHFGVLVVKETIGSVAAGV